MLADDCESWGQVDDVAFETTAKDGRGAFCAWSYD